MNIAIIGSGISGLTCSWMLSLTHRVTLYEQSAYLGGHTNTQLVEDPVAGPLAVDTGFIVFNDWTYPHFCRLLDMLRVKSQESDMSFSVSCGRTGLEYNGTSLNTLFAQRSNLMKPTFYRMIQEILRFNREAPKLLKAPDDQLTMGDYLRREGYSRFFCDYYILPMGAAIWSSPQFRMEHFPAHFFIRFFKNHGMLSVDNRPTWRVVKNGSHAYVRTMAKDFANREAMTVRLNTGIERIDRDPDQVKVVTRTGDSATYDQVILACHSDQALRLLANPTDAEREILQAIPYQHNKAVLHTDVSLMPRRRLAWAAWNYHVPAEPTNQVALTYHMNTLQSLPTDTQYMVTLNSTSRIDQEKIIRVIDYEHPVFTPEGSLQQRSWHHISGLNRTHYCGAYWRYGFHEDGVMSALRVCANFDASLSEPFEWSW